MTRRLDCVAEGCTASIEAETDAEIMEQARAHVADAHPEMELDEDTLASLRARIQDV